MPEPIKLIWNDDIQVIDGEWKQYDHETKQWKPVKPKPNKEQENG